MSTVPPDPSDGVDLYEILPRDEADALTDAMARILLAHARIVARRAAIEGVSIEEILRRRASTRGDR